MSVIRMGCWAVLPDERREIFKEIFPDGKVPLKHPFPVRGQNNVPVYEGDPSKLTDEQKRRLAEIVARRFNLPISQILSDLNDGILPVRAEGVLVECDDFIERFL